MIDQMDGKVTLCPMTRGMCHEFYKGFRNDPAIGHYFEYVYTPENIDDRIVNSEIHNNFKEANTMEVVPFRESDIDAVFEIQRAAYKPLYEKYQDHDTSPYLEPKETVLQKYTRKGPKGYIFIKDGVPVGSVRVNLLPAENSGRISALGVLPQYQGQGIAQQAEYTNYEFNLV